MLKAPHKLGSMGKRRKTKKKRNKEEEAARGTLLLLTSQPWGGTKVAGAGSGIRLDNQDDSYFSSGLMGLLRASEAVGVGLDPFRC